VYTVRVAYNGAGRSAVERKLGFREGIDLGHVDRKKHEFRGTLLLAGVFLCERQG